jgi:hypothetical protein
LQLHRRRRQQKKRRRKLRKNLKRCDKFLKENSSTLDV